MDESEITRRLSEIINANYIEDKQGKIYVKNLTKDNSKTTHFNKIPMISGIILHSITN